MFKVKLFLISISCLGLLSILPLKTAYAEEIQFAVNTVEVKLSFIGIICEGPFFRTSGCVAIGDGLGRYNVFYSAENNLFPPFGTWRCFVHPDPICFALSTGRGTFCLEERSPQENVRITLKETSGEHFQFASDNYPSGKCGILSVNSFLGDRPQQHKPDKDTFSFADTEGDEVTLRLEEDGSVGHIGEEAGFRFRGPIGSASLNEFRTGELPLEITTTIPESGEYEIVIDQKNILNDLRYRGGYVITLDTSLDDVDEIVPSRDVE